jgi:hypothetical protein
VTPFAPAQIVSLAQSPIAGLSVQDQRPSRPWLKISAGLGVLALIIAGATLVLLKRESFFGNNPGANSLLPERSLAYSLTVQKMREDKPYQDAFQSSGQEIFENGWKFRMNLTSPQEGYLYLLNEGPESEAITFNVLFPESETNGGSPRVSAGQSLQTAWMRFDDHQGTEKFWIVWTASPVKELEAVTGAVNESDRGEIKDSAKARTVRDFLQKHSSAKPEVAKDSASKQSIVKGRGDVLVNMIELEHH